MKILSIFGTRPEAIKMCPVIKEVEKRDNIESVVCLTGQHEEMLDQVMDIFSIKAKYNFHIMQPNQTLSMITMNILSKIDNVYEVEHPDIVLVHGDTSTAFTGALAAFYRKIPIAHIEAGLRTFDIKSPYPEEFNRQAVDLIADLYFAPTVRAKKNLIQEGKRKENIYVTGNTVIDALKSTVSDDFNSEILKWVGNSRLILVTAHRRENIGKPMENMFRAINRIVENCKNVKVIYPLHKNPKIRELTQIYFKNNENIKLVEPLDVYNFHNILARCFLVLTDSGGIQEEAPSLGKPVLVMRDTTERQEGIEAGTIKLVGTNEDSIYYETVKLLENREVYEHMSNGRNPYGDGNASNRIVSIIENYLKEK
mgnify:CR=1 FL=1|jgi:UDP-N-acetylglucosamine 2-epimerase (non-hydrolysing)